MSDALSFLISTFGTLFCAALLMRAWIFWRRIPPFNPYSKFIYALTDFIIVPVRKIIPSSQHIDWPSLIVAFLICVLQIFLTTYIAQINEVYPINIFYVFVYALHTLLQNMLTLILWMSIIFALMTWINPMAPFVPFLRALIEPLQNPIRQLLPNSLKQSGIDLSLMLMMIFIIALQMLLPSLLGIA